MSLDEGSEHAPVSSTFLHPSCVCTWERVADHWEMVRLVPHCVMHRHMLDPRYKDAHTWRTPDDQASTVVHGEEHHEPHRPDP